MLLAVMDARTTDDGGRALSDNNTT